jgi:hypothetical protein
MFSEIYRPSSAVGAMTMLVNFRDLAFAACGAYMFLGGPNKRARRRILRGEPITARTITQRVAFRDQGSVKRGQKHESK